MITTVVSKIEAVESGNDVVYFINNSGARYFLTEFGSPYDVSFGISDIYANRLFAVYNIMRATIKSSDEAYFVRLATCFDVVNV